MPTRIFADTTGDGGGGMATRPNTSDSSDDALDSKRKKCDDENIDSTDSHLFRPLQSGVSNSLMLPRPRMILMKQTATVPPRHRVIATVPQQQRIPTRYMRCARKSTSASMLGQQTMKSSSLCLHG